jgi:hypothetical protein
MVKSGPIWLMAGVVGVEGGAVVIVGQGAVVLEGWNVVAAENVL